MIDYHQPFFNLYMSNFNTTDSVNWNDCHDEKAQVDWLINLFNQTFASYSTMLTRSDDEPEYFPPKFDKQSNLLTPAKIAFAHGYFASALHEISHWCIAGKKRRLLADFGYWYEPDGRSASQQKLFESVEVKPQAIEWIFTQACMRKFRVSLDNLNGEPINNQDFKQNVHAQVHRYLSGNHQLPKDAQIWLQALLHHIRPKQPLSASEFCLSHL